MNGLAWLDSISIVTLKTEKIFMTGLTRRVISGFFFSCFFQPGPVLVSNQPGFGSTRQAGLGFKTIAIQTFSIKYLW
jgi:hypothetical protein